MRRTRVLEQYDPTTGNSYAQKKVERCHNHITQRIDPEVNLWYEEGEAKVVAELLTKLKVYFNVQQYMLKKGLKEFPVGGARKS